MVRTRIQRRLRPYTVIINGSSVNRWNKFFTINSLTKGADYFEIEIENVDGSLTGVFAQYQDVEIYLSTTKVLSGWIEEIIPKGNFALQIKGRNKLGQLMDRFVVESYTNTVRSEIVKDLITKYSTGITTTSVQTTTPTTTRVLKGISAFDSIQEMADEENYEFYLDTSNDLHFEPQEFEDSGITLTYGTDTIIDFDFPDVGFDIVNQVDVYGETVGADQVGARVESLPSQQTYNLIKGMRIVDEKLKTVADCRARGNNVLVEKAFSIQQGEIVTLDNQALKAGQLIQLANFEGIADGYYLIVEKRHSAPDGRTFIKVAQYETDLELILVDLVKRMREREKEALDESTVLTKFQNYYETIATTDSQTQDKWEREDGTYVYDWGDESADVGVGEGGATGNGRTFTWNYGQWEAD